MFDQNTVAGTALVVLITWVFAIIIMSLNNLIVMYFEGYYPSAMPFYSTLLARKRKIFEDKTNEREKLFTEWKNSSHGAAGQAIDLDQKVIDLTRELVERFPDRLSRVLPTKFGNAIRAFESYPEVVYKVDAIGFWPRIYLLLSQQIREAVAEAKALVDMWVNIWALSCLIILEFFILLYGGLVTLWISTFSTFSGVAIISFLWNLLYTAWIPISGGLLVIFASSRSTDAAVEWGTLVKACFDLYLQRLARILTGKTPLSQKEQEDLWNVSNQAFLYHLKETSQVTEPESQVELMNLSRRA